MQIKTDFVHLKIYFVHTLVTTGLADSYLCFINFNKNKTKVDFFCYNTKKMLESCCFDPMKSFDYKIRFIEIKRCLIWKFAFWCVLLWEYLVLALVSNVTKVCCTRFWKRLNFELKKLTNNSLGTWFLVFGLVFQKIICSCYLVLKL